MISGGSLGTQCIPGLVPGPGPGPGPVAGPDCTRKATYLRKPLAACCKTEMGVRWG